MKFLMCEKRIFIPAAIILFIVLVAIFAPFIIKADPYGMDLYNKFAAKSFEHPLGTDHLGRDVFARIVYATRMSMLSVLSICILILFFSVVVGAVAGYRGGFFDNLLMRICDIFLTFPTFILALFLIGVLGVGLVNVIIAITLTHWAWYARLVRGLVLEYKAKGYVVASRACGSSAFNIIRRHIMPPVLVQILILATLDMGHMLLHVAGLSFLGLGVQAPVAEWGVMINDAAPYIREHPDLMIFPGLCIFITVILFNSMGEALRDRLDPSDASGVSGGLK